MQNKLGGLGMLICVSTININWNITLLMKHKFAVKTKLVAIIIN